MIHSIYLYPETLYPDLVKEALDLDVSIQVHIAETGARVANCIASRGHTGRRAEQFRHPGKPCIAAHYVHLTDEDREIARSERYRGPQSFPSNMKLASGFAGCFEDEAAGVRVALGTDGCASNNNTDMYQEMRLASFISEGQHLQPSTYPPKKFL